MRLALALALAQVLAGCDPDPDPGASTGADSTSAASATSAPAPSSTTGAGPDGCPGLCPAGLAVRFEQDEVSIPGPPMQAPFLVTDFELNAPTAIELAASGSITLEDPIGPESIAVVYWLEIDGFELTGSHRVVQQATPGGGSLAMATQGVALLEAGPHVAAVVAQTSGGIGGQAQWRQARTLTVRQW